MPEIYFDQEQIEQLFSEFRRGNNRCFFELVSYFLDTLVEELQSYQNYEELLGIGLVCLFCAIKSYHREKQSDGITYVKRYIHLSLLIHRENKTQLDFSNIEIDFPFHGIKIDNHQIREYLEEINQKLITESKKGSQKYIYK